MPSTHRRRFLGITTALLAAACVMIFTGCPKKPGAGGGKGPMYYDFGDILIPHEMKVDDKASFVYKTQGLTTGVLVMNGRVEMPSLVSFFESNMMRDNWRLISSFKSQRTLLLYNKENRWCVINMTGRRFSTYLEIWVSPTEDGARMGM